MMQTKKTERKGHRRLESIELNGLRSKVSFIFCGQPGQRLCLGPQCLRKVTGSSALTAHMLAFLVCSNLSLYLELMAALCR